MRSSYKRRRAAFRRRDRAYSRQAHFRLETSITKAALCDYHGCTQRRPAGRPCSAGAPAGLWVAVASGFPSPKVNDLGRMPDQNQPASAHATRRHPPMQRPMLLPISDRRKILGKVSIGEAARRLGVSTDTIRRRIGKGELLAHREPTPQGYRWEIELQPNDQPLNGHEGNNEALVTALLAQVQAQAEELDARRREVQELHVLLQTAQTALAAPQHRPWWRWWG